MRKTCFVVLVLLVLSMAVSCASSGSAPPAQSGLPDIVRSGRRNAPEDVLVGIGSAKMATQNQSKTMAETRARAEITRAMNSMIDNMVRDYEAGSEIDHSAALSFQEDITVALASARLQGARIVDEDYIDGTYYVVMYMGKSSVVQEINQAAAASKLNAPFSASLLAEQRMNAAFDRQAAAEKADTNRVLGE